MSILYRFVFCLLCCFVFLCGGSVCLYAQGEPPSLYTPEKVYKKLESRSFYLEMRDGVQLACDLYYPANLPEGTRIPTLLHITRYWRDFHLKWPFRNALDPGPPSMNVLLSTESLVQAGYAVLSVDARGSGASYGSEIIAMGPDEVEDGREILDWITNQSWSDGQVAAAGISYNGWAAQMLVTTGHPALKAIIPIHAPFDGYDDTSLPGGMYNRDLINRWALILRTMDKGIVRSSRKIVRKLVTGPMPVDHRDAAMDTVIAQHKANGYADEIMAGIQFRDDKAPLVDHRGINDFFPAGYMDQVRAFQGPVYAFTGWYDMAGPHASTRIFKNYPSRHNKLIIGPWNHFAELSISPYNPGKVDPKKDGWDRSGEMIRFLDAHLKGKTEVLANEKPVHYFTIGAERWNAAETWPPPQAQAQGWFLSEGGGLIPDQPQTSGKDRLKVDTTIGTGRETRWDLSGANHTTYAGFDTLQKHWLCYTSAKLEKAVEITGHPSVRIFIQSPLKDESIFVYLEEITADGRVLVISDGQLRAIHRKKSVPGFYEDVVENPSYLKADAMPLAPGETAMLEFDLVPCSWEVQAGSKLRLAISGADHDHFRPVTPSHELDVLWGGDTKSVIVLPVMRK